MPLPSDIPTFAHAPRPRNQSFERVTFVSCPHLSPDPANCARSTLAFLTWLSLSDHVKIILFASASEFCTTTPVFIELVNLFGPDRVLQKGPLPTHPLGPPLISDWFVRGLALVTTPYVAFINADILLGRE
jgi:hypothetical protein